MSLEIDVEKEFGNLGNVDKKEKKGTKKRNYGTFNSFELSHTILRGITKKGYKTPTPIQRKIIPLMMAGADVLGMARTGSGKSAAFLIPILNKLHLTSCPGGIQCIIVAPTRELCLQIMKFTKELGRFTSLKVAMVVGGDKMEDQFQAIHENPNIIIATPGRLLHLVVEMNLKLTNVTHFIMDEADMIIESGLITQLRDILRRLPSNRQTAFFSATLPSSLVEFSKIGLKDPTLLRLDTDVKISPSISNLFFYAREEQRLPLLVYLLVNKIHGNTVIFAQTRHHVDFIHEVLKTCNIASSFAYSSLDQSTRRGQLEDFRRGKTKVMIVTDLASRGLDLPFLDNVINFYFPTSGKLFVHRVGRVGRCGRVGTAYSIVTMLDLPYLFDLMLFLGQDLNFAPHDSKEDCNYLLGTVPQSAIDEFGEQLELAVSNSVELQNYRKCADNSHLKLKSHRAVPSMASVKRSKKFDKSQLKCHPLFDSCGVKGDKQSLMDGIRKFKPKNSMLELINKEKRCLAFSEAINSLTTKKSSNTISPAVFDTGQKESVPKRFHSEKGLELDMKFHKESQEMTLDLAGTDDVAQSGQKVKWDRKRAKFVSGVKQVAPKIKTESGTYIDASYKTDIYKTWLKNNSNLAFQNHENSKIKIFGHNTFRHNNSNLPKSNKTELKNAHKIIQERRKREKKEKKKKKFKNTKKRKIKR